MGIMRWRLASWEKPTNGGSGEVENLMYVSKTPQHALLHDARCSNASTGNHISLPGTHGTKIARTLNYYKTEKIIDRATPREFELAELIRDGSAC